MTARGTTYKVLQVLKIEKEACRNTIDEMVRKSEDLEAEKTKSQAGRLGLKKQKVKVDKIKEKLVKREGKIYDKREERKHEEEKGEGRSSKDETEVTRDTIRQKDSIVDQLEKEKDNPQIRLETENESLQIIRDTELEVCWETLEKDNNSTIKGHEETKIEGKRGWGRTWAEVQTKEIKSS